MIEKHLISQLILDRTTPFDKGEGRIINDFLDWKIELNIKWNKKRFYFNIKLKKSNLFKEYQSYSIKRSRLFEIITRSEIISSSGVSSKISEIILSNESAINLLDFKKAEIHLQGKFLIYNCSLKRKNTNVLSYVFWCLEDICEDINSVSLT